MKYWKPIVLFLIGIAAVVAIAQLPFVASSSQPKAGQPARQGSLEGLASQYSESCLSPDQSNRPVWECYDILAEGAPHQAVTVQHESGKKYQVLTFQDNQQTKFRFTPTQLGTWSFSTGGTITINAERPTYAKGFVTAQGNQWVRSATGEAFVPQYVMYDKADLDAGLDEFIEGHGFSGFHIINLRDLVENPAYFEAVVLKTYRRGGATHFWLWGDEQRNLTPDTYGVDVDLLYREIAARLAPIPGWTLGYGFDLFEWASASEIEQFRARLRDDCSYHHLIGARGHKNEYREISPNLDYVSWEWHQPRYQDYRDHIDQASQKPVFSEDRFRIRESSDQPKDYNLEQTRRGLWHSAMAGGVANIWGHQPQGQEYSAPYPNKVALKTYSQFIGAFNVNMVPDNDLISSGGYCLRDRDQLALCYSEQPDIVRLNLNKITLPLKIIAVDTQTAYQEIEVASSGPSAEWQPPYASDWALQIRTATDITTNRT
jgi:hypothetical protein